MSYGPTENKSHLYCQIKDKQITNKTQTKTKNIQYKMPLAGLEPALKA